MSIIKSNIYNLQNIIINEQENKKENVVITNNNADVIIETKVIEVEQMLSLQIAQ